MAAAPLRAALLLADLLQVLAARLRAVLLLVVPLPMLVAARLLPAAAIPRLRLPVPASRFRSAFRT